ncbi:hypothetical protein BC830DRAFT_1101822 [Chytriomyces sp. MP71]|nr:hypothetical protein BC830DRAFT_1101822 [Chytriomyces sp. MP71]
MKIPAIPTLLAALLVSLQASNAHSARDDSFLLDTCNCFCGKSAANVSLAGSVPIFGLASGAACTNNSCLGYFPVACAGGMVVRAGCAHCPGGLNGATFANAPPDASSNDPGQENAGSDESSVTNPVPQGKPANQDSKGFNIPAGAASGGVKLAPVPVHFVTPIILIFILSFGVEA